MKSSTLILSALAAALAMLAGCAQPSHAPPLVAPYTHVRSVIVTPLLNHSPSSEIDTIAATDILVAELAQVEGLTVLPANQPLKILAANGLTHPRSLDEATQLARLLGVDGVIIGAITEYQPYKPMKVGMTLQLHWVRADIRNDGADPVELSRQAADFSSPAPFSPSSASQVSAMFDASVNRVTQQVAAYAESRKGQDSPFGWRKYLVDSDAYMHFVCHQMIVLLMEQELHRVTVPARR